MTLAQMVVGRTVTFNAATKIAYGSNTGVNVSKGTVYVLVRLTTGGQLKHCLPSNIASQSAS